MLRDYDRELRRPQPHENAERRRLSPQRRGGVAAIVRLGRNRRRPGRRDGSVVDGVWFAQCRCGWTYRVPAAELRDRYLSAKIAATDVYLTEADRAVP